MTVSKISWIILISATSRGEKDIAQKLAIYVQVREMKSLVDISEYNLHKNSYGDTQNKF